jgi:UDP-3-O-[3-hydroxymyristoyl] glucosamine N-acyltransferase
MKISEILKTITYNEMIGDINAEVISLVELKYINLSKENLAWCSLNNINYIKEIHTGTLICPIETKNEQINPNVNYILTNSPRKTFLQVLKQYFYVDKLEPKKETTSSIHDSSYIHPTAYIGHNVIIHENCYVGKNSIIMHNTVIFKDTKIGNNVKIGANNTIGASGFGFERNANNEIEEMPHIGNVVIEDNVSIGSNNSIDKGVLGSTTIGRNTKIGTLCQIGHNAIIGSNNAITSHVIISGSVIIGSFCFIGPNAIFSDKITIGNNVHVSIGSVVLKSIDNDLKVFGNPARIFN